MGQGEGHRDAPTIRGNSTTADFYVDGVRDDVQYFRDLYNVERVEALKGSNAMIFGRGGGGGVINRVVKGAEWTPVRSLVVDGGSFDQRRAALDVGQGRGDAERGAPERDVRELGRVPRRGGVPPLGASIRPPPSRRRRAPPCGSATSASTTTARSTAGSRRPRGVPSTSPDRHLLRRPRRRAGRQLRA
jgi:outer membrane receptor protein involved in Fe transport